MYFATHTFIDDYVFVLVRGKRAYTHNLNLNNQHIVFLMIIKSQVQNQLVFAIVCFIYMWSFHKQQIFLWAINCKCTPYCNMLLIISYYNKLLINIPLNLYFNMVCTNQVMFATNIAFPDCKKKKKREQIISHIIFKTHDKSYMWFANLRFENNIIVLYAIHQIGG